MAYTFNGSNQYFSFSSAITSTLPLTLACWFNSTSSTAAQGLITVCDSTGNIGFRLSIQGALAGDPLRATMLNSGSGAADSTTAYPTNTWSHACGVFTSTTSRTVYLNGGNSSTNTTSVTQPTTDRMFVGVLRANSAFLNYMAGRIAEVGMWNAALTAAEVASLSDGVSPSLIRPQSLLFYAPLIRDLVDLDGARTFTNNNTATVSNHPRIYT